MPEIETLTAFAVLTPVLLTEMKFDTIEKWFICRGVIDVETNNIGGMTEQKPHAQGINFVTLSPLAPWNRFEVGHHSILSALGLKVTLLSTPVSNE